MECFFFASFGVYGWLRASERFLVVFRERHEDFLIPKASLESSVFNLLVRIWRE